MPRGLSAIAALLGLLGVAYLALSGLAAVGIPADRLLLAGVAASLAVAITGAFWGFRSMIRARATQSEFQRLGRSVDAALRDLSERTRSEAATLADLLAALGRRVGSLEDRPPPREEVVSPPPAQASSPGANVVALADPRRVRPARPGGLFPEETGAEAALLKAVADGALEISLQPILSVSSGAAAGFDVHAHIQFGDSRAVDLRRVSQVVTGLDAARFERLMLAAAAGAARRRLGDASEAMPLHVAVSDALLGGGSELDAVVQLLAQYPAVTRALVVSIPSGAFEPGSRHAASIDRLVETGGRLACEGWPDIFARGGPPIGSTIAFIKLPTDFLLGRSRLRDETLRGGDLVERAARAGQAIVASGVQTDEDALSLIDLGVDLMTGLHFSGPRRLKPEESARDGRVARQ